jgi:hypothetical protein
MIIMFSKHAAHFVTFVTSLGGGKNCTIRTCMFSLNVNMNSFDSRFKESML